jgi:uncharacterized OB-fold protein
MDKPGSVAPASVPVKLIPTPTAETLPFWEGCNQGELRLQRCSDCGHIQFPPQSFCAACLAGNLAWFKASGSGTVLSYTVVHWSPNPAYAADAPYVLALIALEEGPRMLTNIVRTPPAEVRIGMATVVTFENCAPGIALPKFTIVR